MSLWRLNQKQANFLLERGASSSHQTIQSKPQNEPKKCPLSTSEPSVFKCDLMTARSDTDRLAYVKGTEFCAKCLGPHPTNALQVDAICVNRSIIPFYTAKKKVIPKSITSLTLVRTQLMRFWKNQEILQLPPLPP